MKVFITGIDGFLGAALAQHMRSRGYSVAGNDSHICNTGLTKLAEYNVDCRDFDGLSYALYAEKPDVLVHCAATAHEGLSTFSPSFVTKNIFEASVSTFSAAIASGVKRIVFMSSMARYGVGEPLGPPFFEYFDANPVDPYGIAKLASERVLEVLCRTHNVDWCILVPHNIIGPGQKYDDPYRNVVSIMLNKALQEQPIHVYGNGNQIRCFSPVSDCLPAISCAINGEASKQVVNIGPEGPGVTINEIANYINGLTKNGAGIRYMPERPNEVKNAFCSAEKARRLLGFSDLHSVWECIGEMAEFIKKNGTRPFDYFAPIEIKSEIMPTTWNVGK